MSRWALIIIGSAMALYLLLGAVLPTHLSVGDDEPAISEADNGSSVDLERKGADPKDRPSLGGKDKPKETKSSSVSTPGTTSNSTGKRYVRGDKSKKRANLIGPRAEETTAPKTAVPATNKPAINTSAAPTPTREPVVPVAEGKSIAELQQEIDAMKVRINELTAKVGDDPEKAKAVLDLVSTQEIVRKQANKKQAELYFIQAQDLEKGGRYTEAYEKAKLAYEYDNENPKYASLKMHLEAVLHGTSAADENQQLIDELLVKEKQKLVEVQLYIENARQLYADATVLQGKEAVDLLMKARTQLGQAKFTLNSISTKMRSAEMKKSVDDLIQLVDDMLVDKKFEAAKYEQNKASLIAIEMQDIETRYLAKVIDDLVRRAYISIHKEQYQLAEMLLKKVVRLDPGNKEAAYLLTLVQKKGDKARREELEDNTETELRRTWLKADEYVIPYSDVINYPTNWEEIDMKRSGFTESKVEELPEWKKLILAKMERKVTVNFLEQPLNEVIETMRGLVGVTIIVDPESLESVTTPITLSLTNMTFKTALQWVLQIAGLTWALQDEAIFIATPERASGNKVMQIYDVRDLLGDVTHFPGPDMTLGDSEDLTGWEIPEPPDPVEQLEQLVEMIQTKIEPSSWDEANGSSITGREGKLIVTNTPEVHMKIEGLLDSFRKAQKLQVYINARFISIWDNFLEDIGVNWSGLDRDFVPDVAGIPAALPNGFPAGFASDPTKAVGGWDAYDFRGVVLNNTTNDILGLTTMPYAAGQGLNLQYALLGNFQAEIILNAIQKSRKGITLLAPRITVFNTQRAYMMVAQEEAYIADYEGLIATQAAILDPVIKTFTIGMILDVRPIISSDRKYITIELRPTQASIIQLKSYSLNTYVWGLDYPIQAPVIALRKVRTTAVIPDNGILLLGGQIQTSHFRVSSGIPFFSKLPIIGRLFSSDAETNDKNQLLIFVNARIIMFEEIEQELRAR